MRRRPCEARKFFCVYNAEIAILLAVAILSSGLVTSHTEAHDIPAYGNGDGGTATIAEATTVGEVGSGRAAVLPAAQERR